MICPNCDNFFDDDFAFCPHCGAEKPEPLTCPKCGFESNEYSFCPNCGEKILNKTELKKYNDYEAEKRLIENKKKREIEIQREIELEKIKMKDFISEGYFSSREKNELKKKVDNDEISMSELEDINEDNENKLPKIAEEYGQRYRVSFKWYEDGYFFYDHHGDFTLSKTELLDWFEENLGLKYF